MIDITGLRADKRPQSSAIVHALLDRLEAAEKERDTLRADKATLQQMTYSLKDRLEVAEKEQVLTMKLADRLALALNTSNHERDALRAALTDLLNDLEERAPLNIEKSPRVVACGNSVYVQAKAALEATP